MGTYPIPIVTPDRHELKRTGGAGDVSVACDGSGVAHGTRTRSTVSTDDTANQPIFGALLEHMSIGVRRLHHALSLSLSLHTDARLERRYPLTPICIGSPLLVGGQSTGTTPQH